MTDVILVPKIEFLGSLFNPKCWHIWWFSNVSLLLQCLLACSTEKNYQICQKIGQKMKKSIVGTCLKPISALKNFWNPGVSQVPNPPSLFRQREYKRGRAKLMKSYIITVCKKVQNFTLASFSYFSFFLIPSPQFFS